MFASMEDGKEEVVQFVVCFSLFFPFSCLISLFSGFSPEERKAVLEVILVRNDSWSRGRPVTVSLKKRASWLDFSSSMGEGERGTV